MKLEQPIHVDNIPNGQIGKIRNDLFVARLSYNHFEVIRFTNETSDPIITTVPRYEGMVMKWIVTELIEGTGVRYAEIRKDQK